MLISELLEQVSVDLHTLGELGGPEATALADRLATALAPALRGRFVDALNVLVQEFNLDEDLVLGLALDGPDIHLRVSDVGGTSPQMPVTSDLTARIALRVSASMKRDLEVAARERGASVNSWIVRALDRALADDTGPRNQRTNRLRGVGRA